MQVSRYLMNNRVSINEGVRKTFKQVSRRARQAAKKSKRLLGVKPKKQIVLCGLAPLSE